MDDHAIRLMQLAQEGYSCSQIILALGLETAGRENPALIRAMSGLAYGCGTGAGTCGALTAGSVLIGLHAGNGPAGDAGSDRLPLMLEALTTWFSERVGNDHGGIDCRAIVGEAGPAASRSRCGTIVAETYAEVMEILQANGFDPTTPPD